MMIAMDQVSGEQWPLSDERRRTMTSLITELARHGNRSRAELGSVDAGHGDVVLEAVADALTAGPIDPDVADLFNDVLQRVGRES